MYGLETKDHECPPCFVTEGPLPAYIDPKQPPTRKQPFAALSSHNFNHTVELIVPAVAYDKFQPSIEERLSNVEYSKVTMSLGQILQGDFFNQYVKMGNVIMLSEGRQGVDDTFSLDEGVLRLSVDKAAYERAGLVGKPTGSIGTRRAKARWLIEIDLRPPSMLHGKKGFGRILWACKNVFHQSLTWLFYDISQARAAENAPIRQHGPSHHMCVPQIRRTRLISIPEMQAPHEEELEDFEARVTAIHEWIGLVSLESPRVEVDDAIDPFLSRYARPEDSHGSNLVVVTFHGLLPARFVRECFFQVLYPKGYLARCQKRKSPTDLLFLHQICLSINQPRRLGRSHQSLVWFRTGRGFVNDGTEEAFEPRESFRRRVLALAARVIGTRCSLDGNGKPSLFACDDAAKQ